MPPKSKSKIAPNQHDKRHESGLAPPGKRITKKLSNGHLNGQPNGKPTSSVPPSPLPSAGLTQGSKFPRTADSADAAEITQDHATPPQWTERDRIGSDVSLEEAGRCGEMGDVYQEAAPNVEAPGAACRRTSLNGAGATLSSVSTLLAYYPLRDAISILILLLSLPPTLVLVIQALFASLTFVPPTASISLSTLPNVKEIFNSSNFGYPALATILTVDLIFWVCWLPVWKPIQNIFLDLSQAVIAVSLSGASASANGPTYSIATCTVVVCAVHVLRYKAIHLTALDYLRSVIHKVDIGIQVDVPSFATNFVSSSPVDRGWIYTIFRIILGIHIVSQGVTTCIRRSLVKANEQSTNVPAITKSDTEAAAGSEPTARSNSVAADNVQHSSAAQSTDGRPPGPSPSHRDSKPRESVNKKKRKQANQVRSQQPLWAAIASTKVTFVKEMEQRDAFDDAREAARMNTNTSLASSNPNSTTNHIWISEVRDTGIFFSVELEAVAIESTEGEGDGMSLHSGIDRSKPFYVRINGAAWSSTRITMNPNEDDFAMRGDRYHGEIFGLAPLSSYKCEVVSTPSHKVLCSASIITQPAPTAEQSVSASSQAPHQTIRPSSPITTLKQSMQQAENKLNETRNRTKRNKKDQRAVHSDIKREINTLKSKLESSGGTDDKQEKRLMQINQHKNQAEEATAELKGQIEALGEIPEREIAESEGKRRQWQAASDTKTAASKDFERTKSEADRELSALKSEIGQTESKHEKLAARLTQRTQELENLSSKQEADMTAKQKRDLERTQIAQRREEEESKLRLHIVSFDTEWQTVNQKTHDAYQEIASLQSWSTQSAQPPPYPGYSSPPTPDNAFPGANGSLGSPQSAGFPNFGSQSFQSPLHSAHPSFSNPQGGPRGRSSSMLSQYSGFTDLEPDQPRQQYSWPVEGHASAGATMMDDQKEREGSSSLRSGSTGSNSPRPDARPVVPGPIAPPSKNKEKTHSPTQSSGAVGSARQVS